MGNIMSYIRWRGDIKLSQKPFNEVDNLVLSMLSYIDFTGVVPGAGENGFVLLEEACRLITKKQCNKGYKIHSLTEVPSEFFQETAYSKRFRNCKLSHYQDTLDKELQTQFAAMHIELEDGTVYIAFRGTDESILGWREDFTMSYETIPAQLHAVKYLEQTLTSVGKYRLGGHSKGGNLAVYSAMMCTIWAKDQIIEIYNNDGPGLSSEMLFMQQYEVIQDRIKRYIPSFCVIGMLFEHRCSYKIIKSSADGIMQHNGMSWEVEGDHFLVEDDLRDECKIINTIFDTWLEDVNTEQRRIFTNNFFDALEAGGAKNIDELSKGGIGGFEAVLTAMVTAEKDSKVVIGKLLKSCAATLRKINLMQIWNTKHTIKGILYILFGLFFMQLPGHALQILGTVAVFVLLVFSGQRLINNYSKGKKDKKDYISRLYIFLSVLAILIVVQQKILIFSTNFSLSLLLIGNGAMKFKKIIHQSGKEGKYHLFIWGILSVVLGIVALTAANRVMDTFVFTVGTFWILEGLMIIAGELYNAIH
jgi:uncharacterized membrane protein HdeD (DUF308 family)